MDTDSIDALPNPSLHNQTAGHGSRSSRLLDSNGLPAFLVGRDRAGRWLAIEVHGQGGGLFVDRDAALRYAMSETGRRPGAVTVARADMVDSCDFKGLALI